MGETKARKNAVPTRLRSFAKDQRAMLTRAEDLFWEQVRAGRLRGHKFRRQLPIAPYIVDFLCASARVIVELDGPPHKDQDQRRHDARPDAFLCEQGFQVLRFTNDEFLANPQLVLDQVLNAIEHTKNPPPSAGEGGERSEPGEGASVGGGLAPSPATLRVAPSPAEGGG